MTHWRYYSMRRRILGPKATPSGASPGLLDLSRCTRAPQIGNIRWSNSHDLVSSPYTKKKIQITPSNKNSSSQTSAHGTKLLPCYTISCRILTRRHILIKLCKKTREAQLRKRLQGIYLISTPPHTGIQGKKLFAGWGLITKPMPFNVLPQQSSPNWDVKRSWLRNSWAPK